MEMRIRNHFPLSGTPELYPPDLQSPACLYPGDFVNAGQLKRRNSGRNRDRCKWHVDFVYGQHVPLSRQ
ncbi:hypothetical protein A2U01_0031674 [Trifolium medium]|uniref:Uncharacterized protein n=1 Tax=Trifolium medium TaxID=97028 RepID=A0A392PEP7_9FABA|nr:hypothetical protein [Trifolium medium]